ncbi:MAG: UDP-N-acetylmuramoyl-L-alanine--D-glutamate ligase [Bacteroidia bacterium]
MSKTLTKIVVLGAGESGMGAAVLAKKIGADVWVSDGSKITERCKYLFLSEDIPFEEENHTLSRILEADLIIKSPGIPEKAEIMKIIREAGKKVVSEIEFASCYTKAKIIAVTGSNGKTTTTSLIYHLLKNASWNVGLGGNIGKSFALQVAQNNFDYYVLEVSSFQLDDIDTFKPNVAVITNITADHLDRYEYQISKYAAAKFRILMNQAESDYFIYNNKDAITMEILEKMGEILPKEGVFGGRVAGLMAAWQEQDEIHTRINAVRDRIDLSKLQLRGKHNAQNIMAAILAVRAIGLPPRYIHQHLPTFAPIEHRIEKVADIEGVEYINDSKATNVDSAYFALECIKKPIIWIAGGVDKGNDYQPLVGLVKERVKAIVILGGGGDALKSAFGKNVSTFVESQSMEEAVKAAKSLAQNGDCVLLSPCCASFDLFKNYEDRGKQFKQFTVKQ